MAIYSHKYMYHFGHYWPSDVHLWLIIGQVMSCKSDATHSLFGAHVAYFTTLPLVCLCKYIDIHNTHYLLPH